MKRFMKALREKMKNYGLWVSLFALIFMIMSDFGVGIDAGRYQMYVDLLMGILIALGVVSNPSAGKWFDDAGKTREEVEEDLLRKREEVRKGKDVYK